MHRLLMMRNSSASTLMLQNKTRPGLHFTLTRSRSSTVSVHATQPCLVLSNDDGVESPALQSLAAKLRQETGHRVLVVAPARNKSAASMGLTLRNDMELRVRSDLGIDTYALTGTPTDCMMVALDASKGLMRILDLHPIMALSGPNYGPNMGADVLLSGTVGAARTAGLYGVPSLASSSTCTKTGSLLDNAVDATVAVTQVALQAIGGQPARNWPRNHVVVGGLGRRHVTSTCEYDSLPHSWVMDLEQVLVDAFQDGDVFLNLNVPMEWQPGTGRVQTTGLGLMFYRDSYNVAVSGRPDREVTHAPATATDNSNGAASPDSVDCGSTSSTAGKVHSGGEDVIRDIGEALAAGLPIVYNNAYDTRRTVRIECSDVMALQANHISISTLQTWPEGHTLCLSDRVMARALLSAHDGMPAWLQMRRQEQQEVQLQQQQPQLQ